MKLASGLPFMPRIFLIDDPSPNAYAIGGKPGNSAVAVTSGLLYRLNRDELQGVVAHEMSHVANRDTLVSSVAATTAGVIALISDILMRMLWFGGSRNRNHHGQQMPIFFAIISLYAADSPVR